MRPKLTLNLDLCIAINDLDRLNNGQTPIKSIHRLALLIETRYDLDYDKIKDQMYKAQKVGYSQAEKIEGLDLLVDKICLVLDTTLTELVNNIEQ